MLVYCDLMYQEYSELCSYFLWDSRTFLQISEANISLLDLIHVRGSLMSSHKLFEQACVF
jgi:hypothetical protein